jgi:hypothetical protein
MSDEKNDGRFKKGASGNLAGRKPEDKTYVRNLAREHTVPAIDALVKILTSSKNDMARLRSAEALLSRGWGNPEQVVENRTSLTEVIETAKRRIAAHSTPGTVVPFPAAATNDEEDEEGDAG